jgi:DNA-binding MarR family transcriptional regulator
MDGEVMSDNSFFKPTLLYKEFMILDLIEKDTNITQREISKSIGVAVSMTNQYLDRLEKKGFLKRKKHSTKTVEYIITIKGIELKKVLNIGYLKSSLNLYNAALEGLIRTLNMIENKGYKNILLYGAGEVANMILHVLTHNNKLSFNLLAVIDDDVLKIGREIDGFKIISKNCIGHYEYDGILISSFTHQNKMFSNLDQLNVEHSKIVKFFG